jgi:hypothetical protein
MAKWTTTELAQYERDRLASIGSKKDPMLFQAMRSAAPSERTQNRTVIVNYADETTRFGCRFDCSFCSWKERAEEQGDIYPTRDGLQSFLKGFEGYKVTLSGGGDPLYDLDRNGTRLRTLVDWIHELGFLVEVVTKETRNVAMSFGMAAPRYIPIASDAARAVPTAPLDGRSALREIDMWSFSYEVANNGAMHEVSSVAIDRPVRVSKVVSPGIARKDERTRTPGRFLCDYVENFSDAGAYQVLLREDFNVAVGEPLSREDAASVVRALDGSLRPEWHRTRGAGYARYLLNKVCSNNLFLIGSDTFIGDAALGGVAK